MCERKTLGLQGRLQRLCVQYRIVRRGPVKPRTHREATQFVLGSKVSTSFHFAIGNLFTESSNDLPRSHARHERAHVKDERATEILHPVSPCQSQKSSRVVSSCQSVSFVIAVFVRVKGIVADPDHLLMRIHRNDYHDASVCIVCLIAQTPSSLCAVRRPKSVGRTELRLTRH